MKKLIYLFAISILLLATISSAQAVEFTLGDTTGRNNISITANVSVLDITILTESQNITNPLTGTYIKFITLFNFTNTTDSAWNITGVDFAVPDNNTFVGDLDTYPIQLLNETNKLIANGTFFGNNTEGRPIINFTFYGAYTETLVADHYNWSITYFINPIEVTNLTGTKTGNSRTDTWTVRNDGTDVNITNATIVETPDFWYQKIGNTPTVSMSGITLDSFISTVDSVTVYSDVNDSHTLSISFTIPEESRSTGAGSGTTLTIGDSVQISATQTTLLLIIATVIIIAVISIATIIYYTKK